MGRLGVEVLVCIYRWSGMDSPWMIFINQMKLELGLYGLSHLPLLAGQLMACWPGLMPLRSEKWGLRTGIAIRDWYLSCPAAQSCSFLSSRGTWRRCSFGGNGGWDKSAALRRKRTALSSALLFWTVMDQLVHRRNSFHCKDFFQIAYPFSSWI